MCTLDKDSIDIKLILKTIRDSIKLSGSDWELIGFISRGKKILAFGNDSKILGRLFEVAVKPFLKEAANQLGYEFGESQEQTVYPDFWFKTPNDKLIAIDIKSTYRKYNHHNEIKPFNFTLGAYSSFLRNGTKNIYQSYSDYVAHIVIGFLYTRNPNATIKTTNIESINEIIAPYENVEFFVQEKYKIAGQKKGSGNTNNISTIKSSNIVDFQNGKSYFTILGNSIFENYWRNYPLYTDSKEKKASLYNDLPGYFNWLEQSKQSFCGIKVNQLKKLYSKWKSDPKNLGIK